MGEFFAGPITDRLIYAARKKTGKITPEARLYAVIPGAILMPIGLVLFGAMIHFHDVHNSWVVVCLAIGITCFSVQIVMTPVSRSFPSV